MTKEEVREMSSEEISEKIQMFALAKGRILSQGGNVSVIDKDLDLLLVEQKQRSGFDENKNTKQSKWKIEVGDRGHYKLHKDGKYKAWIGIPEGGNKKFKEDDIRRLIVIVADEMEIRKRFVKGKCNFHVAVNHGGKKLDIYNEKLYSDCGFGVFIKDEQRADEFVEVIQPVVKEIMGWKNNDKRRIK